MTVHAEDEDIQVESLLRENVEGQTLYLVEEFIPFNFASDNITESRDDLGRRTIIAEGEFGFCDKPTQNRRRYPRKLMEREIGKLQGKILRGTLLGELDHPDDGMTKAERVAIKILELRIENSGRVVGKFEVLSEKVPRAKTLRGLVESGVHLGVSSRGLGSVKKARDGYYDVQEDFRLLTYDVVVDPAWQDALPKYSVMGEDIESTGQHHIESAQQPQESPMTLEELKRDNPGAYEALMSEARTGYNAELEIFKTQQRGQVAEAVARTASQTRDQVMLELQASGALGGNAQMLESIKKTLAPTIVESEAVEALKVQLVESQGLTTEYRSLAEDREKQIKTLEASLLHEQMKTVVAQHVAFIAEENQQSFFNLLGEASQYTSFDTFEQRLGHIVEEFKATGRYDEGVAEKLDEQEALNQRLHDRLAEAEVLMAESVQLQDALTQDKAKLQEALETRTQLLTQAQQDLLKLTTERNEAKRELAEARELVAEALTDIEEKEKLMKAARTEIAECYDQLEELGDLNEGLELDLHRHKSVIGASNPVSLLEALQAANDKNGVDSLMEEIQAGRRPTTPFEPGTGQHNTQTLMENASQDQGRPRKGGGALDRVRSFMGATPSNDPNVQKLVSESVGGAIPGNTGSATVRKGRRKQIRGLSPEKMKEMMNSHGV